MKNETKGMPKKYTVIWALFTAIYAVWMIFFMNKFVLQSYESVEQRTVDGILHSDITGMIGKHWLYPVWVVISLLCFIAFPLIIKKMLYSGKTGKAEKIFCLASGILGIVFVTWYGFFDVKDIFAEDASITASMIGLEFPWHFRMWGMLTSISIFSNTLYMYSRYGYNSTLGIVLGSVGSAAIFVTINVPSAGEDLHTDSLRCMSHWSGALIFAILCAAPMLLFLLHRARNKEKRFAAAFAAFAAVLLLMIILLVTVGKSGTIENIPVWAAYLVLFLANFTNIFIPKKSKEKKPATV